MENKSNRITPESVQQMANAITIRALKTTFAKSSDPKIFDMLIDAIQYAKNPVDHQGGDGADIVQDTAVYLLEYIGKALDDIAYTSKQGAEVTILRGAFYAIRKTIYNHEQKQYTHLYIDDLEGHLLAVPFLWDIDSYQDLVDVQEIVGKMELTANQKSILSKRLQGKGIREIAREKGVDQKAVQKTLAKIGKKYRDIT